MERQTTSALGRKIAQSTGIVMASVLLSRVLGFFREWEVAHKIGASRITDSYYAAFTLPDFLNYLVAAGSLAATFIPVFSKYMAEDNEEEGWKVFSIVTTAMGLLLILVVTLGEIYAPHIVALLAPGFVPVEKARVVFLTRLMLPAQFCFCMHGLLSAVQYAKGRFIVPQLAPLVYNTFIILGGVLLASRIGITGFAVGVVAGAIAGNFLLQIYGAIRAGAKFTPSLNLRHPGFIMFVKLAIPIMLALSLSFTDDWVIRWFGSYLQPASITWLTYGKTLMRVPLGIVGQAIGVASFPVLATLYSEGRLDEMNRVLHATMKGLVLMLVPIAALTMAQSRPLVHLVFSHTRLHESDLNATAATLVLFSLGMFGWGAQNILARAFYATHDTITPAVVGTVMTFATLPLYWLFVRRLQHLGLALESSIGITMLTVVLFILLVRRTRDHQTGELLWFTAKVMLASAVGGFASWKFSIWMGSHIGWRTMHGAFVDVSIVSLLGIVLTAVCIWILRVPELTMYARRIYRGSTRVVAGDVSS
ncbi:MAG: murein biosynthesis integral membrane protein MurJ [Candidatus Acidiferrales bacterium]